MVKRPKICQTAYFNLVGASSAAGTSQMCAETSDTPKMKRSRRRPNRTEEIPEDAQTHIHLGRRRRCRVPYNKEILDTLERAYAEDEVPVGKAGRGPKEMLAVRTGLTYYQIDKWFDNRRIKEKKLARRDSHKGKETPCLSPSTLAQHMPLMDANISCTAVPAVEAGITAGLTAGIATGSEGAVLLAETCVPVSDAGVNPKDPVGAKVISSSPLAVVVDMEMAAQQLIALDMHLHVSTAMKQLHEYTVARHVHHQFGCVGESVARELFMVDVDQLLTEVRAPLDVIGSMAVVLVAGHQHESERNARQSLATMLRGKLKVFTEAFVSSLPQGYSWRAEALELYDALFHSTWPLVLAALPGLLPAEEVQSAVEFCCAWDTRHRLVPWPDGSPLNSLMATILSVKARHSPTIAACHQALLFVRNDVDAKRLVKAGVDHLLRVAMSHEALCKEAHPSGYQNYTAEDDVALKQWILQVHNHGQLSSLVESLPRSDCFLVRRVWEAVAQVDPVLVANQAIVALQQAASHFVTIIHDRYKNVCTNDRPSLLKLCRHYRHALENVKTVKSLPEDGEAKDSEGFVEANVLIEEWLRDEENYLCDLAKSFGLSQGSFDGLRCLTSYVRSAWPVDGEEGEEVEDCVRSLTAALFGWFRVALAAYQTMGNEPFISQISSVRWKEPRRCSSFADLLDLWRRLVVTECRSSNADLFVLAGLINQCEANRDWMHLNELMAAVGYSERGLRRLAAERVFASLVFNKIHILTGSAELDGVEKRDSNPSVQLAW